jgi:hypothetical protein
MFDDNAARLIAKIRTQNAKWFQDPRRRPEMRVEHESTCASRAGDARCDCAVRVIGGTQRFTH